MSLDKARTFFRQGKFADVIRILEPQVFAHREDPEYYYLLGVSCLRTGDYGGGYSYLQRALQLSPGDLPTLFAIALVHIRRGQVDKALQTYLSILDIEPGNRRARRGLQYIRRGGEALSRASRNRERYLLGLGRHLPRTPIVLVLGFVLLSALGLGTRAYWLPAVSSWFTPASVRPVPAALDADTSLVATTGDFAYVMTETQIRRTLDRAKDLFSRYRDNAAKVEINRLYRSNASVAVKEIARTLDEHLTAPRFDTYSDHYTYADVMADPALYEGVYVLWKGKAANVELGENDIRFRFLVGYHDEKVLEGDLPARIPFAYKLEPGASIEVLGAIELVGGKPSLVVSGIHELKVD